MEKQIKFQKQIIFHSINLLKKQENLLRFLLFHRDSLMIQSSIMKHPELTEKLNELHPNLIEEIKKNETLLEKSYKGVNDFYYELVFKSMYQAIEEYIFDLLVTIFSTYPKFIQSIKSELDYDVIFNQNNIEHVRKIIIERRVKSYIQSNNIVNTLDKFKTVFGVDLEIDIKDKKELYYHSRIRNILTHNNGVVNKFFIDELNQHDITHNHIIGDKIYEGLDRKFNELSNLSNRFRELIEAKLTNKLDHFAKYEASM